MIFKTYGSGSSGNSYTLTSSTGCTLVLDAGVKCNEIFADTMPSKIAGVLITHRHGDHALYGKKYADSFIDVYAPMDESWCIPISSGKMFRCGEYEVKVFEMKHDVPCVGYLIRHKEITGDILYATDTNGIPWKFKCLALAIIEADYDKEILQRNVADGKIHNTVAKRTLATHQSINQAINFIINQVENAIKVVFVHLSADNAQEELFRQRAEQYIKAPVYIAKKGLEISISKYFIFEI